MQKARVLQYMEKNGSITSAEAFFELGVSRLSAVIFELRKTHEIEADWEEGVNRFGERTRFVRYRLADRVL